MTTDTESPRSELHALEIVATILLGLSTVLIAASAWFEAQVADEVTQNFNKSIIAAGLADSLYNEYTTDLNFEMGVYLEWITREASEEFDSADEVLDFMSFELIDAINVWLDDGGKDVAFSPFEYDPSLDILNSTEILLASDESSAESLALDQLALEKDAQADQIGQSGIFYAIAMFWGGLAVIIKSRRTVQTAVVLGWAAFIVATWVFVSGVS